MPSIILRLLMGKCFPIDGSIVFLARWNGQQADIGPIGSSNLIIVEREVIFSAQRSNSLEAESHIDLGYTCLKTKSTGLCSIPLNISNLLFQKTVTFTPTDDSDYHPVINVCIILDTSLPRLLGQPVSLNSSVHPTVLVDQNEESKQKVPALIEIGLDDATSNEESDSQSGSSLTDPLELNCIDKTEISISQSEQNEMFQEKGADGVKKRTTEETEDAGSEESSSVQMEMNDVALYDPKLHQKCVVLMRRLSLPMDHGRYFSSETLLKDLDDSKDSQDEVSVVDLTGDLTTNCKDEKTASSESTLSQLECEKTLSDDSFHSCSSKEEPSSDEESDCHATFTSLPDVGRRNQAKRKLNFSNPLPKRTTVEVLPFQRALTVLGPNSFELQPAVRRKSVFVDERLATKMKRHQKEAVQFMWKSCFAPADSSLAKGCIVTHEKNLGRKIAVVALSHALLTNACCKVKRILVVCPESTVMSWMRELESWLPDDSSISVCEFASQETWGVKAVIMNSWLRNGGIMVMDYKVYLSLITFDPFDSDLQSFVLNQEVFKESLLNPGPDLIVCDDARHLDNKLLFQSINRVKTKRRILLSGPLLNSLSESRSMVNFVNPYIFKSIDFNRKFVEPISRGLSASASPQEVRIMKQRKFVFDSLLGDIVLHFGHTVVTDCLPPKHEYIVLVKLTEMQELLYSYYMGSYADGKKDWDLDEPTNFDFDFNQLSKVWSHPKTLLIPEEATRSSSSDASDEPATPAHLSTTFDGASTSNLRRPTLHARVPQKEDLITAHNRLLRHRAMQWWGDLVSSPHSEFDSVDVSGKMRVLFDIFRVSELKGEKLAVFSRSKATLDVIEHFMEKGDIKRQASGKPGWRVYQDYFRMDDRTQPDRQTMWLKKFNDPMDRLARLCLVSSQLSGLNLVGANRVVLFDLSVNPKDDLQCLLSVYRFGQKDPVYVNRLVASDTIEERLYNLQVSKMFLGQPIDGENIGEIFSKEEQHELYYSLPNTKNDPSRRCNLGNDSVMTKVASESCWIELFHQHDSLLEPVPVDELPQEEQTLAWRNFYES